MDDMLIYSYTRAEAIADGSLIDVSATARAAGIRLPVALTAALWYDVQAIPAHCSHEDVAGRLWDLLWMLRCALLNAAPDASTLRYDLILHVEDRSRYTVKAMCGPGDDGEPVITLMCPEKE